MQVLKIKTLCYLNEGKPYQALQLLGEQASYQILQLKLV